MTETILEKNWGLESEKKVIEEWKKKNPFSIDKKSKKIYSIDTPPPYVNSPVHIGQAITYTLGLWKRLTRYIENGQVEIDNNLIENSIRPVAIGRKNYLFAGSHEAAQQAAMIYSFLGTCKINNVEPSGWLKDVLQRIQDHSIQKLDELLPTKI